LGFIFKGEELAAMRIASMGSIAPQLVLSVSLLLGVAICTVTGRAQGTPADPPSIVSISICSSVDPASAWKDCPRGARDTEQAVLAPGGGHINSYGGLDTLADEHSAIFPPGAFPGALGYTFFVAARTSLNTISSGATVLTGGAGPDRSGQWTLDFAPTFGLYKPFNPPGSRNGQLFISPLQHDLCPTVADATKQDPTMDLNYADPGSVVLDPTNPFDLGPGSLLMIYEADNRCLGLTGGNNVMQNNSFYSVVALATSFDFGHTWPTYRYDLNAFGFPNFPMPSQNPSLGPEAPDGARGRDVCVLNNCFITQFFALPNYGRYPVLRSPVTPQDVLTTFGPAGGLLTEPIGEAVPSAFVDDVGYHFGDSGPVFVYEINNYAVGDSVFGNPSLPGSRNSDLVVSRAQLNGGTAPLAFEKYHAASFSQLGLGGKETPIFPSGPFANCEADNQGRTMGSLSYVETTHQYLLIFVCMSPMNPATQEGKNSGAAWFFSTNSDPAQPGLWTTPQQIIGSWMEYDPSVKDCADFHGWYPTFMSLGQETGHLEMTGYVFYLAGCTGFGVKAPPRQYSTRSFIITTN
jgi:hypothetical protein